MSEAAVDVGACSSVSAMVAISFYYYRESRNSPLFKAEICNLPHIAAWSERSPAMLKKLLKKV